MLHCHAAMRGTARTNWDVCSSHEVWPTRRPWEKGKLDCSTSLSRRQPFLLCKLMGTSVHARMRTNTARVRYLVRPVESSWLDL